MISRAPHWQCHPRESVRGASEEGVRLQATIRWHTGYRRVQLALMLQLAPNVIVLAVEGTTQEWSGVRSTICSP